MYKVVALFVLVSCASSEHKRELLNFIPLDNEDQTIHFDEDWRQSSVFDEPELPVDYDLEKDITDSLLSENERAFFQNLGEKIKISHVYTFPLKNHRITSLYGRRTHPLDNKTHIHQGIDLTSKNSNIYAIKEGVVISARYSNSYGNFITIRHPENLISLYAHNSKNLVNKGDYVKRGQIIGKIGATGRVSGRHLHFEIRQNNKNIDPINFFRRKILE